MKIEIDFSPKRVAQALNQMDQHELGDVYCRLNDTAQDYFKYFVSGPRRKRIDRRPRRGTLPA